MNKIELIQNIGNEVCEGCGPDADCGIDPSECSRIDDAVNMFDKYISDKPKLVNPLLPDLSPSNQINE